MTAASVLQTASQCHKPGQQGMGYHGNSTMATDRRLPTDTDGLERERSRVAYKDPRCRWSMVLMTSSVTWSDQPKGSPAGGNRREQVSCFLLRLCRVPACVCTALQVLCNLLLPVWVGYFTVFLSRCCSFFSLSEGLETWWRLTERSLGPWPAFSPSPSSSQQLSISVCVCVCDTSLVYSC